MMIVGPEADYIGNPTVKPEDENEGKDVILHAVVVTGVKKAAVNTESYLICVDPWKNLGTVEIKWDADNSSERPEFALFGMVTVKFS